MNVIDIIITILTLSFVMAICLCEIYKDKLEKKFDAKLDVERSYWHELEERYCELYNEFVAHMNKYH